MSNLRDQGHKALFKKALEVLVEFSDEELMAFLDENFDKNIIYDSVTSDGTTGPQ